MVARTTQPRENRSRLQTQIEGLCGVLVLDKPPGWTSHDAVNKMRRIAGTKKIGHLGTLDPLATGVLPLVVGRATRLAQFYTKDRKAYSATIRFGHSTDSYDRDGVSTSDEKPVELKADQVEQLLARFRGPLSQMPPPVSAKKINGVPAYKLVRQQKPVELNPVDIEVFRLDLMRMEGSDIEVHLECTSGTYVRSIAHELGLAMGCGAYVQELRRTLSGEFAIADARTLEQVEELARLGKFEDALLKGERLLPAFPAETVDLLTESQIRQGRDFRTSPFRISQAARLVKAMSQSGELVAIGEQKLPNLYHPILVL
jgi:tRNA pseudouridine55 synthase